jgi:hypothetical protein
MATEDDDVLGPDESSLLLRAMIEELTNQINALERSQRELADALVEEPDDADFLVAVQENEVILARKREELVGMQQQLLQIDIAYRQERLAESRNPQPSVADHSRSDASRIAIEVQQGGSVASITETHDPPTQVQSDGHGLYI